ncbi:MAG: anthranilate synthase/aminodeoxychorismate synthase-like glutamine amidotransferase [Bacteroidia bacterium]|jgi:anthranilate synthase/aminodeoxychorismate synthase-like glutamine amidotransferase|tara:strand:+ start:184 stop:777 length:594 start_codon:yes stop_codon:yes gene_type:complete
MLLLLDNYDSFTYNLYDYFVRCGAEVEVIRNDEIEVNTIGDKYTGIILSPGPGTPQESGSLMDVIHLYHNKLPIFGVCLGMQAIGTYFGAKLVRASFPMHGKQDKISYTETHPMFNQITGPLHVCRYHSLILTEIEGKNLVDLAYTQKNELMALAHASLPIWAVQFHPEAILTSHGLTIIDNWLSSFTLHSTKLARM